MGNLLGGGTVIAIINNGNRYTMIPSLLYLIAVICSMMSQLPFLVETGMGTILKYSWILPLLCLVCVKPKDFINTELRPFFILLLLFAFYCFMMTTLSGVSYMGSDIYNITLSFTIALISYVFWKNYSSETFLTVLGITTLICAGVLAYVVYSTNFVDYDIMARQYGYTSKNSLSPILFTALLIANVLLLRKGIIIKIPTIAISILVLGVIIILKSRSTLLAILFVVAYFSLSYKNKHTRHIVFFICVALAIWLISNPSTLDAVYNGIILSGRDAGNIDDISSGRLTLITKYWNQFLEHPFFGIGNDYMDCFPLIILAQYGIIGASIVFGIILFSYKRVKKPGNESVHLLAFLILISFLINCLFEAQPPFGPGAKCFFLWMMFGFHLADNTRGYLMK